MRQVKALVLVGGFGESEYLRSRLQAEIRTRDNKQIVILQPPNASVNLRNLFLPHTFEG